MLGLLQDSQISKVGEGREVAPAKQGMLPAGECRECHECHECHESVDMRMSI